MVLYKFDEITRTAKIGTVCSSCGKRIKRTVSATSTVNPFNKNDDGIVKNRQEVVEQVIEKLEKAIEFEKSCKQICKSCDFTEKAEQPKIIDDDLSGITEEELLEEMKQIQKREYEIQELLAKIRTKKFAGKIAVMRSGVKTLILDANFYGLRVRKLKGLESFELQDYQIKEIIESE